MSLEIERKFVCAATDKLLLSVGFVEIWQAYISTEDPEIRIRSEIEEKSGLTTNTLTIKKKTNDSRIREELEIVLSESQMVKLAEGVEFVLTKRRYKVGGWEIDVYPGTLVIAEAEGKELPEIPDGLTLIEEVTGRKEYSNSHIAKTHRY